MAADRPEYDLFEKTELRIENIGLTGVNLDAVAEAVGGVFGLDRSDVIVIDAREDRLALDLHREAIDPRQVVGQEAALFRALAETAGVAVSESSTVSADGMLGWIAEDRADALEALDRADSMRLEIDQAIANRALVLSTGHEVLHGHIEDTNQPFLLERLAAAGYSSVAGGVIDDDRPQLVARLREAAGELGFGMIVTTGGVGAEDKDHTVEAFLELDPDAATPYITHFQAGHGRHAKDGVRIAVAQYGTATLVALPGPHDEVVAGIETVIEAMAERRSVAAVADRLAETLRLIIRTKFQHGGHGHG